MRFLLTLALAAAPTAFSAAVPMYRTDEPIITAGPTYRQYAFDPLTHLTGIAPYFDSPGFGLSPEAPDECTVKKAAYLVRHGAIYANDYDYESIMDPFLQKLANASADIFPAATPLGFLQNWTSPYTNPDDQIEHLTKSGALEAYTFGQLLAARYPGLIPDTFDSDSASSNSSKFKVYASSAERSSASADSFKTGLFALDPSMAEVVTVSEGKNQSADSLAPHESCPNFSGSRGSEQESVFKGVYTAAPIARLNSFLAAGTAFNFTAGDVVAMQQLCGYETVIRGTSPFCALFTPVEWLGFEYLNDIMYHFELGYGNALSPVIGMPWVNATTALLLADDGDDDQDLVVSFTHREEPPFVVTALGLFNDSMWTTNDSPNDTFPLTSINYGRQWKTSEIIPFLGHVALERLSCTSYGNASTADYVRAIVNSAPRPLPGCDQGPGASCPLAQFQRYVQARAATYGDFVGQCDVTADNGTNVLSVYEKQ